MTYEIESNRFNYSTWCFEYAFMHSCIHTYIHVCMSCKHVMLMKDSFKINCPHVCIFLRMYMCMHAFTQMPTCMHVLMHACMHTYIHTYIHTCKHTPHTSKLEFIHLILSCMYVCTYVFFHACMFIRMQKGRYVRTPVCVCVCTEVSMCRAHVCMCVCTFTCMKHTYAYKQEIMHNFIHSFMHTRMHACIHTYVHTYIHVVYASRTR